MFKRISVQEAKTLLEKPGTLCVDIRDETAFSQGRIPSAQSLGQHNMQAFLETEDPDAPLLVCCYHGMSSQSAAQFLFEKGFEQVYSIDGGFEAWKSEFPIETG